MPASIGVILPNHNYARYLPDRIASILGQERMPEVLVFLDDASTDRSWEIAPGLLAPFPGRLVTWRSPVRSGSVLHQWQLGLERLDTELVWIAEADDRSEPGFLAALAARLEEDPAARFAFCGSRPIGPDGAPLPENPRHFEQAGDRPLTGDTVFAAGDFLRRCLMPRNMVVNASAVLWRATALAEALRDVAAEFGHWLCAGDWRVYAASCARGGTVQYLAAPLNEHRRHGASVTGATSRSRHFGEVALMHARLRELTGPDAERDAALRAYLGDLRRAWGLSPTAAGPG